MAMTQFSLTVEPTAPAMSSAANAVASLSLRPASPVERLPTELLRQIVRDALPPALIIDFTTHQTAKMWQPKIRVAAYDLSTSKKTQLDAYTSLLSTCKKIAREARGTSHTDEACSDRLIVCSAMLYDNNQFSFHTTRLPLPNERLTKLPYHSLRDMRHVYLVLEATHEAVEHEKFLQQFISVIRTHSQDESKRSVLKRLEVRIQVGGNDEMYDSLQASGGGQWSRPFHIARSIENCMYTLEALIKLPIVDQVKVSGPPAWFSQCLQLCVQGGHGSSVAELYWPTKKARKTKKRAAYRKPIRMAKEPILDWTDFAQRNDIDLPDAIEKFYVRHSTCYPRLRNQGFSISDEN